MRCFVRLLTVATFAIILISNMTVELSAGPNDKPAAQPASRPATPPDEVTGTAALKKDATALRPLAVSELSRRFLAGAADLPSMGDRTLYFNAATREYLSEAKFSKLPEDAQKSYQPRAAGEAIYYNTKYGSPLAYSRVIEMLAKHGVHDLRGKRLLDYGYGTIGHLKLLSHMGVDAVGVDVDPLLRELYNQPEDQTAIGAEAGGDVTLVHGSWPGDADARRAVGGKYDIITSKNTLKNGYIHPERPVDKRMLVHLGVSDEAFVTALADALKPGGLVVIYNICPAQNPPDKDYIPWADGRCPFPRDMWNKAGFEVLAFDEDDSVAVRRMGETLGWNAGAAAMNLEKDLFAHYSVMRKKR